jgi:hypothetical protein
MGSAKCSYVDEHVLSRASAKVYRLVSGMLRSQARSTADIHGQSVLRAGRRARAGDEFSINCGFPVLARPPQHDRGHRTIGIGANRSSPLSSEPSPKRINADIEDRGSETLARTSPAEANNVKIRISGAAHGNAHRRGGIDRAQSLVTSSSRRFESNSRLEAANLKALASMRFIARLRRHYVSAFS